VQEAYLRAQVCFAGFRGDDMRSWLLQIVHHASHSRLDAGSPMNPADPREQCTRSFVLPSDEPCQVVAGKAVKGRINAAIAALPVALREVLVLRELEDMTYSDVARIVDVPIGTVMSRLSHARETVWESLMDLTRESTLARTLESA
jgi:RNA polymerase sigma-70 factor (ECF subfamily)